MFTGHTLSKIRVVIPVSEASDEKLAEVLYSHPSDVKNKEDKVLRERIVAALGYDPNDKWAAPVG